MKRDNTWLIILLVALGLIFLLGCEKETLEAGSCYINDAETEFGRVFEAGSGLHLYAPYNRVTKHFDIEGAFAIDPVPFLEEMDAVDCLEYIRENYD